jgi:hypothetical protein
MPPVGADQGVEDGQDVPAIFDHAGKDAAKLRLALGVLVPLSENSRGNLDIATQLFRGMSAKEQAVKESGLALGKSEVRDHFSRQHWCDRGHGENAVYPKLCPRQVGRRSRCHVAVKTPWNLDATERGLTVSNRT